MGYKELIASLRKEGEVKVKAVRDEADSEAEKIRDETAARIELLREEFGTSGAKLAKEQEEDICSAADKKARTIKLSAEESLSGRLFALALSCLRELRGEDYERTFSVLINELPPARWTMVRVNPTDVEMARTHLSGAEIDRDDKITGGIETATEYRKLVVINTFEKRLERSWEEILPSLFIDTYKETSGHGISSED